MPSIDSVALARLDANTIDAGGPGELHEFAAARSQIETRPAASIDIPIVFKMALKTFEIPPDLPLARLLGPLKLGAGVGPVEIRKGLMRWNRIIGDNPAPHAYGSIKRVAVPVLARYREVFAFTAEPAGILHCLSLDRASVTLPVAPYGRPSGMAASINRNCGRGEPPQ